MLLLSLEDGCFVAVVFMSKKKISWLKTTLLLLNLSYVRLFIMISAQQLKTLLDWTDRAVSAEETTNCQQKNINKLFLRSFVLRSLGEYLHTNHKPDLMRIPKGTKLVFLNQLWPVFQHLKEIWHLDLNADKESVSLKLAGNLSTKQTRWFLCKVLNTSTKLYFCNWPHRLVFDLVHRYQWEGGLLCLWTRTLSVSLHIPEHLS